MFSAPPPSSPFGILLALLDEVTDGGATLDVGDRVLATASFLGSCATTRECNSFRRGSALAGAFSEANCRLLLLLSLMGVQMTDAQTYHRSHALCHVDAE